MVATPKPASTVVLMDDDSRVYLTKRPVTMKFMGGFHVFPGGSVDAADYVVNFDHVNSNLSDYSFSPAYYISAARELFEEVGVLLGHHVDGTPAQLPKEQALQYRQQLIKGEISFNALLEQERMFLDLNALTYFGQIVTPEEMPIRFDTRFFLAKLPHGQVPEPDATEIEEALWISPAEALSAYENNRIKLALPTIISLQTMIKHQNGGKLIMSVTREDLLKLLRRK